MIRVAVLLVLCGLLVGCGRAYRVYDQAFELRDEVTGEPMTNQRVRVSGLLPRSCLVIDADRFDDHWLNDDGWDRGEFVTDAAGRIELRTRTGNPLYFCIDDGDDGLCGAVDLPSRAQRDPGLVVITMRPTEAW